MRLTDPNAVIARGEVEKYILNHIQKDARELATKTADHFGISRQAVHKHFKNLVTRGLLHVDGPARRRSYKPITVTQENREYLLTTALAEDLVWSSDVSPVVADLPRNVKDIWQFCFTEIFNNAIDHSSASKINVDIQMNSAYVQISVKDDGVGIFKKIKDALNLEDERHALLELAKGKVTTDSQKHSGQGIFFTSRMLDEFHILSSGVFYNHNLDSDEDWILGHSYTDHVKTEGTVVSMQLNNNSPRVDEDVFERFTSQDDASFSKTVVPVRLAKYGDEQLISRSQAKRLVAGLDRFRTVLLNFEGVETIGQAFADEIFRVFARSKPNVDVRAVNANDKVSRMVKAAQTDWMPGASS
jgi:DNA-binding Lrp family transcriptional regulator